MQEMGILSKMPFLRILMRIAIKYIYKRLVRLMWKFDSPRRPVVEGYFQPFPTILKNGKSEKNEESEKGD
jgi:hypothetical protein